MAWVLVGALFVLLCTIAAWVEQIRYERRRPRDRKGDGE